MGKWQPSGDIPLQESQPNTAPLYTTTAGARNLSLSNMAFHCLASSGAGACRSAGVAETVWVNVLPARKAVLVRPTTWAMRSGVGMLVKRMKAVSPIVKEWLGELLGRRGCEMGWDGTGDGREGG